MIRTATADLCAAQNPDGFFLSEITMAGARYDDSNGFATVQVLRALGGQARDVLGDIAQEAALDALERCRNQTTGAFGFWARGQRPDWAPSLPDDADDTALMLLLLYQAGRMDLQAVRRVACRTVICHRTRAKPEFGPPWIRGGVFKTWMRPGTIREIVDCTVNANVLALLAASGLQRVPGYLDTCTMIEDAVAWVDGNADRAMSVSPFYPEPGEFVLAIEAAVREGVTELLPTLDCLGGSPLWQTAKARALQGVPIICGSAYGLARWRSPAVGAARRIGLPRADGEPAIVSP